MVVSVFPLAKIGLLLMKQLSKPVANIIKNRAKKQETLRKHVIAPIGRAYQWIENKTMFGAQPPVQVTEEEAVELGANAMGEIVLFGLLCLILLAEMSRQGDKKAVMEKTKAEEISNMQDMVLEINEEVNQLKKALEDIQYTLQNPPDLFDLEEQRHQEVTDHNFWDIMIHKHKRHIHFHRKKDKVDVTSPSI